MIESMNILVTGGAGYVGSVISRFLRQSGHNITVLDNLSRGFQVALEPDVRFIQADIANITDVITPANNFDAVVHLAAYAYVGESVEKPELYWNNNVVGTIKLLDGLRELGIRKIAFASTCATYGEPTKVPITENEPTSPVNTYGMSKLAIDMALSSEARTHDLAATSLRFFNVAGAFQGAGERHNPETHIIPLALDAASGRRKTFTIFGADYPTPDGTCIRDYIHVLDLARAIELSLASTKNGEHKIYNLGTGHGFSNKEILEVIKKITGKDFPVKIGDRRPGDPPKLVAANELAHKELGWQPEHSTLEEMINDAWQFHQNSTPQTRNMR
jgi:UDP-glucose 4-epimerase